ncbi:MAG TPA: carbon storage regulator [Ktedonobacterales bacterium]|nr:carbon storage regulator [Ktedonobacterales bacterium]
MPGRHERFDVFRVDERGSEHMLVLRRKAGEAIVLNGVITIHVLAVEGERVKLGIDAPPEVVIVRSELLGDAAGAPRGLSSSGSNWRNRDPRSVSSGRFARPPQLDLPGPSESGEHRVPNAPETSATEGASDSEPRSLVKTAAPLPQEYEN